MCQCAAEAERAVRPVRGRRQPQQQSELDDKQPQQEPSDPQRWRQRAPVQSEMVNPGLINPFVID